MNSHKGVLRELGRPGGARAQKSVAPWLPPWGLRGSFFTNLHAFEVLWRRVAPFYTVECHPGYLLGHLGHLLGHLGRALRAHGEGERERERARERERKREQARATNTEKSLPTLLFKIEFW